MISQSGLHPSNCRLLDPARGGDHRGLGRLLRRADRRVRIRLRARRRVRCGSRSNAPPASAGGPRTGGTPGATRPPRPGASAFLDAPYLRDSLSALGRAQRDLRDGDHLGPVPRVPLPRRPRRRGGRSPRSPTLRRTARERRGSCAASPTSIPSGPAPYYTVLAKARRGSEVEQWDEIKAAVSEAIISAGGTITHHHAVGRDHRPWYDMQRPDRSRRRSAPPRRRSTPEGILNPGVLIDSRRPSL